MRSPKKVKPIPGETEVTPRHPAQVNAVNEGRLDRVSGQVLFDAQARHDQTLRLQSHGSPRIPL
jgi:hypothetical protein